MRDSLVSSETTAFSSLLCGTAGSINNPIFLGLELPKLNPPERYTVNLQFDRVEKDSTVAIFGLGTVGLAVAEGARIRGASRIIGVDVNPQKFEIGRKFGVTDFVNPKDHEMPVHQVIKEMSGRGVDYSFDCTGNSSVTAEAFKSTRGGWGTTVVLGVNITEIAIDSMDLLCGKSIKGSLFGGMKAKSDLPPLVDMYMKKELQLDDFITHQVSFSEINKAFDLLMEGECLRCIIWIDNTLH